MKNVFFFYSRLMLRFAAKKKNWIKTIKGEEIKNKTKINIGTGVNRHDK
jgi:hypothetical protein